MRADTIFSRLPTPDPFSSHAESDFNAIDTDKALGDDPSRPIFLKKNRIEPKRGPIDASHRKEFGGGLHSLIFLDLVNDFARALIRKIT